MNKLTYLLAFCLMMTVHLNAQKHELAVTKIEFSETAADNTQAAGKLVFNADNPKLTEVTYSLDKNTLPNPYKVDYTYYIKTLNDAYAIEISSVIGHMDMRIDESVQVTYTGDDLLYPFAMNVGTSLENASGSYRLEMSNAPVDFIYNIEVNNRKITGTEMLSIAGENYEAYVIELDYKLSKTVNDREISTVAEQITEYYVPGMGVINRSRTGNTELGADQHTVNTTRSVNHISVQK